VLIANTAVKEKKKRERDSKLTSTVKKKYKLSGTRGPEKKSTRTGRIQET